MEYNFKEIEQRWQQYWKANQTYKVEIDHNRPKFYVLDMFPYPSGAGLHVGHPLGYIASDIYSRYKRLEGFNVLHPMGYDAFGLPAEQYAIQTGQHPALTTENNIKRYRQQLDKIGFSYDWNREVRTCDSEYYHWTQWVFIQMYDHWYNNKSQKAEPIEELIKEFAENGNANVEAAHNETEIFTAQEWNAKSEKEQQLTLLNYRLAYLADTMVNWCPELGTVLANDEVKEGVSVRGGHPVEQKVMKQWLLRVSAYAERLLTELEKLNWTDSLKEIQRNWIGRSVGADMYFQIKNSEDKIQVFTTRPDTVYGATFMVLAPESELVAQLTTDDHKDAVAKYIADTKKRTERERLTDVKTVSGQFTGSYTVNPFTGNDMPIWISDYVLAGYGTGAIMAVPAHDNRDYAFAKHFNLSIVQVVEGANINEESYDDKSGKMINSGIINDLDVSEAIPKIIEDIVKRNLGNRKINYRLRDAIFSRQRYWGEPFPMYFKDGVPYPLSKDKLPLELPEVDTYLPTEKGEPPLGRAEKWENEEGYPFELSTMPGFAGSSAYYLRYMDSKNKERLVSKEANEYWENVDLYIGGTEHATGHLIYSRFWNKFLFDLGLVCKDEPFKKLINQGMIQGRSNFVYRVNTRKYAEEKLWEAFKRGDAGFKFKRDFNLDHEIYCFCCEEKKLIVEVSNPNNAKETFEKHNDLLAEKGYKLLVLNDIDIATSIDKIVLNIKNILGEDTEITHEFDDAEVVYQPLFISKGLLKAEYQATSIHADVNIVYNDVLNIEKFKEWRLEYKDAQFVLENDKYVCGYAVEKMSKSMYNVVNPDDIIEQYGADTLRLYEMFLGPLEQSKPWDTKGIEGVNKFLKRAWRLFFNSKDGQLNISDEAADKKELKILHKTIKKIKDDIERFSFNTAVSAFMICVNELYELKCNKREILERFTVLLSPFAPHIAEELWRNLGHNTSVCDATFPELNEEYLIENTCVYPVAFNGKRRFEIEVETSLSPKEVESIALGDPKAEKWLSGKPPRKVIVVPKRMVNVVV